MKKLCFWMLVIGCVVGCAGCEKHECGGNEKSHYLYGHGLVAVETAMQTDSKEQ